MVKYGRRFLLVEIILLLSLIVGLGALVLYRMAELRPPLKGATLI